MGQYYKAYLRFIGGRKLVHNPQNAEIMSVKGIDARTAHLDLDFFNYFNGMKLLEHSWMGNSYTDSVLWELRHPAHVAWVGDYSEETCDADVYGYAWGDEEDNDAALEDVAVMENGSGFLVNETKLEYIDMREWYRSHKGEYGTVHPLPLLTAVGNGLGGGDYRASYPDSGKVGSWAFDLLFFTPLEPRDGYRDMTHEYRFRSDC